MDDSSSQADMRVAGGWDMEKFKRDFSVVYLKSSADGMELEFELRGAATAMANAVRRVLIGEVPTVCIESVWYEDNTSVLPEEILAHRIGLVPLKIDPRRADFRQGYGVTGQVGLLGQVQQTGDADFNDSNTFVFKLDVKCKEERGNVLSGDLVFVPSGDQEETFAGCLPEPVVKDILLCKLRKNQRVAATCYAHKGDGRDHAKFSPVSTASYRLAPTVKIIKPVPIDVADKVMKTCQVGCFDIEESTKTLKVVNQGACTVCRNCIREEVAREYIELGREDERFIFSVESTGILPSRTLVVEALQIMINKCSRIESALLNPVPK